NPTNGETTIRYYLPEKSDEGRIYIYDILGKQVKVYELLKGSHSIILRAAQLNTGVYFIAMELDGIIIGREKMVMNKF
ncbi:MAG: T9SS type A sorting domain-containing protein, partial [Cytophagales bacterium]|nr:T9SS type A sorting domain-containing protein [Cytophagales bacterium]